MITRILYNVEAEQSVLGGIILENSAWDRVADLITAKDFYQSEHEIIYNAIISLLANNKPVDWVTLANELKKINQLENIGGDVYLVKLLTDTPTTVNIRSYAEIVKQHSHQRQLIRAAQNIIGLVEVKEDNALDKAQAMILSIAEKSVSEPKSADVFMTQVFSDLIDRYHNEPSAIGLSTGFNKVDEVTLGLQKSNLILLAARPSMGKTLLAVNMAEHALLQQNKSVLIFSLEMTAESIGARLLTSVAKIPAYKIKKANLLTQEEIEELGRACQTIKQSKLVIDDSSALTVMDIRAKARRIKQRQGLDLIIIDYVQLIKATEGENETLKVGYISRELKSLAKELNVPLLVLSQLNRNIEGRANRRPMMSDLRQSGALEQDADVIMFIDRPERYDDTAEKGLANIYIEKNRDGTTGEVKLLFRGDWCRFENYTERPFSIMSNPPINKKRGLSQDY